MSLLVEPFLQRHPDFVLRQRILFRVPVAHFTTGMAFERTGHKEQVCLRWYVRLLFAPPPFFRGGLSGRMHRSWGLIGDSNLQSRMLEAMEDVLSDIVAPDMSMGKIFQVDRHANRHFGAMQDNGRGLLHAALGAFSEAGPKLQAYVDWKRRIIRNWHDDPGCPVGSKRWEADRVLFAGVEEEIEHLARLIEVLERDGAGEVAAMLHAWEEMSVEAQGLERYWTPSPFPFENP